MSPSLTSITSTMSIWSPSGLRRLVREDVVPHEVRDRLAAAHDSLAGAQQVTDERALQGGVRVVERHGGIGVLGAERLVPLRVDPLDRGSRRVMVAPFGHDLGPSSGRMPTVPTVSGQ